MKTQFKNWTLFFVAGSIAIIAGLLVSIILMNGVSAPDALFGMYILMSLLPLLLIVVIDRILVWKFGNKPVNKIQFSLVAFAAFLWMIRFVMDVIE
ncbi:hypothetical protein [Chryseobacterium sp. JK1]|uniref:hypothetical protein n=1 Tax=Chryseobacterium sp. JK1 TaxID=874294 RepID=UPI003D698529